MLPLEQMFCFHTDHTPFRVVVSVCPSLLNFLHQNPLPLYQSLIFKHWQDQYEITLLAVSDDTWIVQAGKCPETQEEALRLAKDHFIYCHYVLESYPTLGHYTDYLMKHDVWYFWWD
ncbi:hypothetical protein COE51_23680 [Bacillus pseudomycoides]|nr:hypothetical protein COE51_23680 [Bacillus pseudomycoides]